MIDNHRILTCRRKIRHKTKEQAERTIWQLARREGKATTLNAYYCPMCRGYHVGHRPQG
jgi:hypothetical protein